TDALDRLGTRLIAIDRPGLGRSDPAPERTLLDGAADVRAIAAELSLDRPAIVGFSQGAPLALACGAAKVVSAVALVSGTDELAAPALRSVLPPPLLAHIEMAATDPAGLETMFRGMTADSMMQMITAAPEVDQVIYRDAAFVEAFTAALHEGLGQGPGGFVRDALLVLQQWPFDPSTIEVPVHLWYGGLDASLFHSPDLGATLAHRIRRSTRTVIENAGGAILWTHGAEILAALLEARRRG
ncbi:MAG TPA: alpha/beta hydrolase, partial [Kofleriaceae bacterium]